MKKRDHIGQHRDSREGCTEAGSTEDSRDYHGGEPKDEHIEKHDTTQLRKRNKLMKQTMYQGDYTIV